MASEGPNNPATAADDSAVGTVAWTTIDNIKVSDNSYANTDISGIGVTSHYAKATNFGFSIPSGATINGILVEIERSRVGGTNIASDHEVKIVKSNATIGSEDKSSGTGWNIEAYISYGGSSDLWSESWTDSDINNSNFGVVVSAISSNSSNVHPRIDHVRITVTYTEASSGTNMQLNIGDSWKAVPAIKINIGDSWKDVVAVKQNIGDAWKDVF